MTIGSQVQRRNCPHCMVGTVRTIADDQALVDYPNGRSTWVDLKDLEVA